MARTVAGLPEGLRLIRGLMHEAATKGDVDSDQLSFVHTVRVIRRKLPRFVAISPSGPRRVPPGRAR